MIGIVIMTVLAFVFGILLVTISGQLEKKQKDYLKYLPGYNCGVCGFGSCKGMNEAMQADVNCYKKCKLLKGDALKRMEQFVHAENS